MKIVGSGYFIISAASLKRSPLILSQCLTQFIERSTARFHSL